MTLKSFRYTPINKVLLNCMRGCKIAPSFFLPDSITGANGVMETGWKNEGAILHLLMQFKGWRRMRPEGVIKWPKVQIIYMPIPRLLKTKVYTIVHPSDIQYPTYSHYMNYYTEDWVVFGMNHPKLGGIKTIDLQNNLLLGYRVCSKRDTLIFFINQISWIFTPY